MRSLSSLALVVLAGCPAPSPPPTDSGVTMDAGNGPAELANCAAWARAECQWRARCFGASDTACQPALQQRCSVGALSVSLSTLGYDAMKASTCASQAATRACDASLACSPFTVTAKLGDACLTGSDCGEGQECGGLACPATCSRHTLGTPCDPLECVEGTCDHASRFCRPTTVAGRACTFSRDCSGGLACHDLGASTGLRCTALPMRGQACVMDPNDQRRCRDEDFCDSNAGFTCKARLAVGTNCNPSECVPGATCDNGTCTVTTPGSRCDAELECPSGTWCLGNRCEAPASMHGATCSAVNDCLSPQLVCGQVSNQCIDRTRPLLDQELCDPRGGRCADGLACEEVALNDWRCRRHSGRAAGISCSDDAQCESLKCANNVCAAPVGGGQPCTNAPCLPGFSCVGGTCVGAGVFGARCQPQDGCLEGVCLGGSCSAPQADGASCRVSAECASGRCRDGKCLAACTTK